jgi:glutaredoxin
MPDASWTKVIAAGKPESLEFGGENGVLELYAFGLKSGEKASLMCKGPSGQKLAVGRVSTQRPHCKVRGLLAEPVELSTSSGEVVVTGILKGGVYKTLTAGLASPASEKRARSPEKAQEVPEKKKAKTEAPSKKEEGKGKEAPKNAKEAIASSAVVFFSQEGCPFCTQAEQALKGSGILFKKLDITPYRAELSKMTKKTSAPSVWVKGTYVGGCNDGTLPWHGVKPMLKSGKLQEMLRGKKEEAPSGPVKQTLKGGLSFEVLKAGNGPACTPGKTVHVRYEGRLAKNGKRFDKGTIKFGLGRGEVISGWDHGVNGMKRGEKRRLLIPFKMGYGSRGAPPDIPPNADLVFDVELLS